MADRRLLEPAQLVTVDAPRRVRADLPVSFTVGAVDDLGVHLVASGPLPELAAGTPVAVSAHPGQRPLAGLVVTRLTPTELVVQLAELPERRVHPRADAALEGEWQTMDEADAIPLGFTTVDLSEGGLRIRVAERLVRGDRGFVTLTCPGQPTILAICEVVDYVVGADGGHFEVRLRFAMISEENRTGLARVLAQLSQSLDPTG